jgi:alginate production protein
MALAAIPAWGVPVVAEEVKGDAEVKSDGKEGNPAAPGDAKERNPPAPGGPAAGPADSGAATAPDGGKQPAKPAAPAPKASSSMAMAQFVIPKRPTDGRAPAIELPQRLTYQYAYGTQSDVVYRRDADLNRNVRDDSLVFNPQLNGYITYRPTDWLETTLEMMIEREVPAVEEAVVVLPNGETQLAAPRRLSLIIDQLFVALKAPGDRFRFTVGRRNYEDERHWLFDTSMDVASLALKLGKFRVEAAFGREILLDLDLLGTGESAAHQFTAKRRKDLINTYLFLADYRGIEDLKLGAFLVFRDDRAQIEGRPLLVGLSAHGMPSLSFNYWAQLGLVRGTDETSQRLSGYGFDVGATYQFMDVPLHPSATLGYAFGSGDNRAGDGRNREFRQTGLQSNEARFAGIAKFRVYGEALDPELTNLRIMTAGLGVRPAANFSVDLVYHRYWLNEVATDLRSTELTALMNQVDGSSSRDVGSGLDIVIGVRNLFGVRRLGVDLRAGWFFPGEAFLLKEGTPESPIVRNADKAFTTRAKFWF